MSNVIKSFRVIEKEYIKDTVEKGENTDIIDNTTKEILLYEANSEAELIIKIAEERSKQILEEAEKNKVDLINKANTQSKEIFEQSRQLGYDEGYKEGHIEGFEKGYGEGKAVSDELIKDSLAIKDDYISQKNNLLKELEGDIIQMVINIYEKILDKEIQEDDNIIIPLVLNGIKNLDPTDKLVIITSKEDFDVLNLARDEILAKASLINELDIKYDINLSKGDCILETSKGNIDISMKDQLNEVRELLTTILNNE